MGKVGRFIRVIELPWIEAGLRWKCSPTITMNTYISSYIYFPGPSSFWHFSIHWTGFPSSYIATSIFFTPYLLSNPKMAGIGLIPTLFNFLLTLAGKLLILTAINGEWSENVENSVQYIEEEDVDSLDTIIRRLRKKDTVSLLTQVETGAEMDVRRSFENPMKKSIPPFTFSVLPPELVFMIALDLQVSSQACLALVERYLHSVLKDRLKSRCLQLSAQEPASFPRKYLSVFLKYRSERWIFLRLLEIDLYPRWGLCIHCLKLHPFHQFPSGERGQIPHRRHYAIRTTRIMDRPNRPRQSMFDVCPCINLTRWCKRKLEERLSMPAVLIDEGNKEPLESISPFVSLHPPRKGEFWWHECRKIYGSIEVTTKVRPSLGEFGELLLTTQYEFQDKRRSAPLSGYLCCPHPGLHTWVYKFLLCRQREVESMKFNFPYHM